MSILIVILVFSVLIIVHEWGHFMSAKKLGVGVERFSIGFGKKLLSWTRGGTEFTVCLIPLGGFVKMTGDDRAECQGRPQEFFSHPVGHRAVIVSMGALINYVFAFLCFYVVFMAGFPSLSPRIGKVVSGPAEVAGLQEGDQVLSIDGRAVESWDDIPQHVMDSRGDRLRFGVQRKDAVMETAVVPERKVMKNIFGVEKERWIIGIQPSGESTLLRYGPVVSLGKAADHLLRMTVMTYKAIFHVVTGSMPVRDAIGGPIMIFDFIREAATLGFSYLLLTTGVISASLAMINLFPIPVLDGGYLVFFLVEKIRGRPLPRQVEEGLMRVGMGLLIALMIFVLYNDMAKMGWVESLKHLFMKIRP